MATRQTFRIQDFLVIRREGRVDRRCVRHVGGVATALATRATLARLATRRATRGAAGRAAITAEEMASATARRQQRRHGQQDNDHNAQRHGMLLSPHPLHGAPRAWAASKESRRPWTWCRTNRQPLSGNENGWEPGGRASRRSPEPVPARPRQRVCARFGSRQPRNG